MNGESEEEREARIRALWQKLDTKKKGNVDFAALKNGLTRMNHPLKDADHLIRDILAAADIDRDGRITYDDFSKFCSHTEKELWTMFRNIDHDRNGDLDKKELSAAFAQAGVAMSNARLERFFGYIDKDHNGAISFEEWRDFLLFLPAHSRGLHAVLSYYNTTTKVTAEGDVAISDDNLQGLGTSPHSLKQSLFGVIYELARSPSNKNTGHTGTLDVHNHAVSATTKVSKPGSGNSTSSGSSNSGLRSRNDNDDYQDSSSDSRQKHSQPPLNYDSDQEGLDDSMRESGDPYIPPKPARRKEIRLTDFIPDVGYFLAGGLSGITSRTMTAPLDRLKVYLIAQTGSSTDTIDAVKSGDAAKATRQGARTLVNACRELWAAGGIRSLFAGNGINVVKVMPESAVKFGSYEAAKRAVAHLEGHDDPKHISSISQFAAGGCAGMISQAVVYPLDTLKFRMQCEVVPGGERGNILLLHTAQKMWQQGALRSFYRGLPMGLIGMFPYAAIDLFTFETLKKSVIKRNMQEKGIKHEEDALPGNFTLALMGGFSGAIGASAVYPLNLLRTRLQSQGSAAHPRTYTGIIDVTRQTLKHEGVRGLFKGLTPNLLKVVPAVSITYVVYENTKKALHLH